MVKLGNRRKRRNEYLLDVKVHTEGRLRARARWLLAVGAVLGLTCLTCFGVYRLIKFTSAKLVYENPKFAISQIVVEDNGIMTQAQILGFAGVAAGQNILSVDMNQVQRNLESLSIVRRVEVRRMMPSKLFIHIDERLAVAHLRTGGAGAPDSQLYIDRTGTVMMPVKLRDGTVLLPQISGQLPLLTGIAPSDVHVGKPVQSEQIYRALELLDKLQQAPAGSMMEIAAIDLSKPRHLTLTTRQNTVVKFDVADFPQQLRRLSAIMAWSAQRQKAVQVVDLTVARGVPVTFLN